MFMLLHVPDAPEPAWYWWVLIAACAVGLAALGGFLLFRRKRDTKVKRMVSRAKK
jgi:LPXTG-motif cell wall-anchored protein